MGSFRRQAPPFRITQLRQTDGVWRARVSVNGSSIDVDTSLGTWLAYLRNAPRSRSFHHAELHPDVKLALVKKTNAITRRESRQEATSE